MFTHRNAILNKSLETFNDSHIPDLLVLRAQEIEFSLINMGAIPRDDYSLSDLLKASADSLKIENMKNETKN